MKTQTKLTLTEHQVLAKKLLLIESLYDDVIKILSKRVFPNHKIHKSLKKDLKTRLTNNLRCSLDDEYHRLIDNETFNKLGHIYYNRHKKVKFEATVNLPEKSDYIINKSMYSLQGERIIVEQMFSDPEYHYLDYIAYIHFYKGKELQTKKRTKSLVNKLIEQEAIFTDCAMWRREWLTDFVEIT